jgi:hypothetical protein
MSFTNPTPLRVGAKGTLHGWTVTVAGRVVLGVEVDGERYYWNEYNLIDANGRSATLVYEEGEDGPEWKLFQLLPPQRTPLTISEAETKSVGDKVSFGGAPIPVTLVDRSRVHHIEGTAPEGVEVGDLADFFNADAGDHMIVASWTGNEIEFYEGRDVPEQTVDTAFNLTRNVIGRPAQFLASDDSRPAATFNVKAVLSVLTLVAIFAGNSCFSRKSSSPQVAEAPRPRQTAPALRLAPGASGTLGQQSYTVTAHALVEVGRVGSRFDRREYQLTGGAGGPALLVNGLAGGTKQWHLLQPAAVPANLTPHEAATRRKGTPIKLGSTDATITELFLSQSRTVDGTPAGGAWPAGKQYGFVAAAGGEWWLARWDERNLTLYRGTPLDEKVVFAALGPGPEK